MRARVGDIRWRVEWISGLAFDESGDVDLDRCTESHRTFDSEVKARAFAESIWPKTHDKFGIVEVDQIEFVAYDERDGINFPWVGYWECCGTTAVFSGEWEDVMATRGGRVMSQHAPGTVEALDTRIFGADRYAIADTAGVHLHKDFDSDKGHWASQDGAYRDIPEAEELANAERIALCWNSHDALLEACKHALERLEASQPEQGSATWNVLVELRAAISLAEGR